MKKLVAVFLSMASTFSIIPMAFAGTTKYVETNHGWVDYHTQAKLSSPIVGRLELGQRAILVRDANAYWYEIRVNNSDYYITTNPKYTHVVSGQNSGNAPTSTPSASQTAPTAQSPTPAIPAPKNLTYTTKSGDTLDSIAKEYGVTVSQLLAANPQLVPAGTTINLPANAIPPEPSWQVQADKMIAVAKTQLGAPYYWGHQVPIGSVPVGQKYGFDCSNFVAWSYKTSLGIDFSGASKSQRYNLGTPVALNDIREGDVLFFKTRNNDTGSGHVGIYMGNGEVIQCGGGWGKVTIEPLATTWLGKNLVFARRVIN